MAEGEDRNRRSKHSRPLSRMDSLDVESAKILKRGARGNKVYSWDIILKLAFQSIGIIYGDIGTSPLYVYSSTFSSGIKHTDDILGVLSLIVYTITLITLVKYVLIVLWANDNGEGGTFALYSLICRYAKVGFIPTEQAEDKEVSTYRLEPPDRRAQRAQKVRSALESSSLAKYTLLLMTMLGTSMVIGDGILTPCISGILSLAHIGEFGSVEILQILSGFSQMFLDEPKLKVKSTSNLTVPYK